MAIVATTYRYKPPAEAEGGRARRSQPGAAVQRSLLVSRLRRAWPAHPFDGHTERPGLGFDPTSGLVNRGADIGYAGARNREISAMDKLEASGANR
jgi:hypothetical protein